MRRPLGRSLRATPRAPRHVIAALAAILAVGSGAACTSDGDPDNGGDALPEAVSLLEAAADEMAGVENARVLIETDADVAGLGLRRLDGVITRSGDAEGTAQLQQLGILLEIRFVALGDTFHVNGLTGGWQRLPMSSAATVYDPSAILDPDRGVARLLRTATDAQTQGAERIDGVNTYRVTAAFDQAALHTLLPGIGSGVTGTLWIGADRPLLHRARFTVPGPDGAAPGTVTATFSDFNAQVNISAP